MAFSKPVTEFGTPFPTSGSDGNGARDDNKALRDFLA